MTKKSIKLNASNIINMRDSIIINKKTNWKYIMLYNLMSKKEINAGLRKKDPKSLYNEITQMIEKIVYIKGMLFYLNMGKTTFDKDEFKKTNNYSIFQAQELKELVAKLMELKKDHTLNPKLKATKGLKNIGKEEVFTSAKIDALIKDLQLKIAKFDAAIEEFNTKTDIDISSTGDDFIKMMAA